MSNQVSAINKRAHECGVPEVAVVLEGVRDLRNAYVVSLPTAAGSETYIMKPIMTSALPNKCCPCCVSALMR